MRKANQKFGKIGSGVGFRKTDGVIVSNDVYLAKLESKGYTVERTPNGIIITPPSKGSNN